MAIFNDRICRTCGVKFSGGPRAWYCPACRAERKRDQKRKYNKYGYERHIGDIDHCKECGNTYIVQSGLQRYCPECKEKINQRVANEQSTKWYHECCDKDKRNKRRREQYNKNKDKINEKRRNDYDNKKDAKSTANREYYKRKKQKQNAPEQD